MKLEKKLLKLLKVHHFVKYFKTKLVRYQQVAPYRTGMFNKFRGFSAFNFSAVQLIESCQGLYQCLLN